MTPRRSVLGVLQMGKYCHFANIYVAIICPYSTVNFRLVVRKCNVKFSHIWQNWPMWWNLTILQTRDYCFCTKSTWPHSQAAPISLVFDCLHKRGGKAWEIWSDGDVRQIEGRLTEGGYQLTVIIPVLLQAVPGCWQHERWTLSFMLLWERSWPPALGLTL